MQLQLHFYYRPYAVRMIRLRAVKFTSTRRALLKQCFHRHLLQISVFMTIDHMSHKTGLKSGLKSDGQEKKKNHLFVLKRYLGVIG